MTLSQNGKLGENFAAEWLQKNGYSIIGMNYHTRFGEIDIIAKNDEFLAFVEVKTRSVNSIARPMEWVTPAKQKKIIISAESYLQENPTELQPRFDVIEIITASKNEFKVIEIQHYENAFGV